MRKGAKSGGARKVGRNREKCAKYRLMNKHEWSHINRIKKHMKKYKDTSSMIFGALERWKKRLKVAK